MGHWESAGMPNDFDGIVRLFPLPNLILFPHVIQPLHIFEPRYCEMLTEALESDHLIAMVLLRPGWESTYQGKPAIADTICIGRIISHTPTDDGRHNILLAGIARAKLVRELPVTTSFRQAEVEILHDVHPNLNDEQLHDHRESLLNLFRSLIPQEAAKSKTFADLLTQQLPLGILTDIIGYALNLPIPIKQSLLGEPDIEARYQLLMEHLGPRAMGIESDQEQEERSTNPGRDVFPPRFSEN